MYDEFKAWFKESHTDKRYANKMISEKKLKKNWTGK